MRFDVIRWRQADRTVVEESMTADAASIDDALKAATDSTDVVHLVLIRKGTAGRDVPWDLFCRDWTLPVPARGDLRAFGTLTVPPMAHRTLEASRVPETIPDAAVEALAPAWGRDPLYTAMRRAAHG